MSQDSPIAIIGLSYRAPGIGGKGLWDYLSEARSAYTSIPPQRFDHSAFYNPGGQEKSGVFRTKGAHFVPGDIYAFDAAFFNMRAEEARNTDPQFRMMLECALEAAEDAGKSLLDLDGQKIGVFIGAGQHEYSQRLGDDQFSPGTFSATGVAPCMAANRISYFFNIDGPSVALDAACASSAYAAHVAASALRNGECSAAFVGAASLNLGPGGWLALGKTGALSAHGRSFSYDVKGTGFGRGEGATCLLLKRMDDAIRDGDPVHALIRSSAWNHGGRPEGITMPSGIAHRKLLRAVHEAAGLDPSQTPVVEGHGTGTAAGDPIEAGAFTAILGKDRTASNPILLGSVKSNFGHLEGASGLLGIVKVILMIKNGIVLPTAGFEQINPKIEGKEKIRVLDAPVPWPGNEPKRALVTNFGFGGSNSALILEEAPSVLNSNTAGRSNGVNGHATATDDANRANVANSNARRLFVLSAKTRSSLVSYLSAIDKYLDETQESSEFVRDLSYTLGQRRTHHPYRTFVVANSVESLQETLSTVKPSKIKDRVVAFVFTGQGAQYAQMASGLQHYEIFSAALQEAEKHLKSMGARWCLKEELAKPDAESRINEAEISQPACTALQLALVSLLRSWELVPHTVTGHSSGEIAAAYAAGILSFRGAIAISYYRGQAAARLSSQEKKGAMLALGVGPEEASALIEQHAKGYVTVAAINSAQSVTISGDSSAIQNVQKEAESRSLFARKLKVEIAYHSRHMEDVTAFYLAAIEPFCDEKPSIGENESRAAFVSCVTGNLKDPSAVDASYWVKNLVRPVRFLNAMQAMFLPQGGRNKTGKGSSPNVVVEVGPHSALKGPIKQSVESLETNQLQAPAFTYLSTLLRGSNADETILDLAGNLFTLGVPIQLGAVNQTSKLNSHVVNGLPAYAWDKSTSYSVTPRPTYEKLSPGEPYHPLLGRRNLTNGGMERAYRQVFTVDELPWIRDHNVAGVVIFPMTGYLSCAIEATRRTLSEPAAAFLLRNVHIVRRLEIEEEQKIDLATKIRPTATGTARFSSTLWSFEISSWSEGNNWTVHSYGQIEAETAEMTTETPNLKIARPLIDTTADLTEHDAASAYAYAGVRATRYGPTFQNTYRFFEGKDYTVLEHRLRDLEDYYQGPYGSPVTVDPPTLDGFLQGGGPLQVTEDGRRPAQMPNFISRFRISNKISAEPKQRFDIITRLIDYDFKGGRMNISVAAFARASNGSVTPVADWETVGFRSIGSADEDIDPASHLPTHWAWETLTKFDLLPLGEIMKMLSVDLSLVAPPERIRWRNMSMTANYWMDKALKATAHDDRSNLPFQLKRFIKWATRVLASDEGQIADAVLIEKVRKNDAQGELLCLVGEQLVPILRKEIEPLEIMLPENRLTRHYEGDVMNAELSKVVGDLVANLGQLETNLRILEIGAGTAGTTLHVMEALSRGPGEPAFANYTFTDISSGFFEHARTKLSKWSNRVTYKKFDVSQDPLEQGFTAGIFDVVIAANVLHATYNMAITMANVRTLLQPSGKLFLLEANGHAPLVLPFALLPGWWYCEDDYRDCEEGPMMTVTTWNRLLVDCGFSGVDVNVKAFPDSDEESISVITSTRVGKNDAIRSFTVSGPFMDDEEVEFAQEVADSIADSLGCPVETKPFTEIDPADDPYLIFIDSPRHSLLKPDFTPEEFESLQSLLVRNTGLLWLIPENGPPESKFIKGLVVTLRQETEPKNVLVLEGVPSTSQGIPAIVKLAERLRDTEVTRMQEQDFVWNKGVINLPRMKEMPDVQEQFAVEQGISYKTVQNMWAGDRALEMTIDAAGSPDSIYFRRINDLQGPLGEDEILIEVDAAGVSNRDLNLVLGSIPWAPPGFDGAGKVVKVGSQLSHLQEGDRVFFLALEGSAFSTYKKMQSWHAAKIPANISTTDAASMPLAYSLAVLALIHTARIRKNETILIQSAAGAVGQACVVLAQHLGAKIFATAGSESKRKFLHKTFDIPENQIFSSRTPEFRDRILCATAGKGVDVIINSLTGELLTETWDLTASFGRFVDIGKNDAFQNNHLPMKPFDSNVSYSGIDLRGLFRHRPEDVKDVFSEVVSLLHHNIIKPIQPVTVIPISQFATCLRKLRSGDTTGKFVVTLGKDESVMAESALRPTQAVLKADGTYVITGGTRGIGLNLAYWMIDNGARNVVLLGRSGSSGPEAQKMLKQYEGTDVCVRALFCNVGSRKELADALDSIKDFPPIRGVIHSALVLSDKYFELATYDDFETVTKPRVNGALHLQELLPEKIDFFIALSSFLGDSGNVGQAIYAGTASFYDAFAQYRNARGQYTVTVALPVVLDVGYVADNELGTLLKQSLGATLTMKDIRTIIKCAIASPTSPFSHNGKVAALKMYLDGQPVKVGTFSYFHPVHTRERLKNANSSDGKKANAGADMLLASWTAAEDPQTGLTEALITKVAAMTMMERDEVGADMPLASFSLDSLVSVELRNWIRRETAVELTLGAIMQASSLSTLATDILTQREAAQKE